MRNISFILIMLLAAFGCASVAVSGKADSMSRWIGSYDSVSGKCGGLLVEESRITWGSCKQASARLISVSASELVLKIDPSAAECGWAGLIVALGDEDSGKPRKAASKITISAYQSMDDYKSANRYVQCSYLRKEK